MFGEVTPLSGHMSGVTVNISVEKIWPKQPKKDATDSRFCASSLRTIPAQQLLHHSS